MKWLYSWLWFLKPKQPKKPMRVISILNYKNRKKIMPKNTGVFVFEYEDGTKFKYRALNQENAQRKHDNYLETLKIAQ